MDKIDILLLTLGSLLGLVLALFIQPLLEDRAAGILVRTVARFWIRPRNSLTGTWASVMLKDGVALDRSNEITNIKLYEVRRSVSGTFSWKNQTYRILAKRNSDDYLTGTYEDIRAGHTFHGAFQLRILPNEEIMFGRWIGFNTSKLIIEGPWQWRRYNLDNYEFEKNTRLSQREKS